MGCPKRGIAGCLFVIWLSSRLKRTTIKVMKGKHAGWKRHFSISIV